MVQRQTILITGSNGQLGKELKRLSASYPVYSFIFSTKNEVNITDRNSVQNLFDSSAPSFCINCAAYTAVDNAEIEIDEAFLVNSRGVEILASICKEYNTAFIHLSTDYVFDGTATTPYTEGTQTNPVSVYGKSKLAGEKKAMEVNADSIIIRTAWVYSEFGKNFVKTMLRLMSERPAINVVNDQFGSPTYAADLAQAIMDIISSGNQAPGIFHFTNEGIISWYDFALAIKELTASVCKINPIPTSQYPTAAKRPAYSVLDNSKISATYNIQLHGWKESLQRCLGRIQQRS